MRAISLLLLFASCAAPPASETPSPPQQPNILFAEDGTPTFIDFGAAVDRPPQPAIKQRDCRRGKQYKKMRRCAARYSQWPTFSL